jgi:hypothetical protein
VCDGSEDHHEFKCRNRCPYIPAGEWIDVGREHIGPGDRSLIEEGDMCPAWYGRSPAAVEIARALSWRSSLSVIYPLGVPVSIVAGVEYAEATRSQVMAEGRRLDREDAERERRERERR